MTQNKRPAQALAREKIRLKWLRRFLFRWAFKGCAAEHPEALAYARETMGFRTGRSIEDEIRMERALVLDFWAKRISRDD